MSFQSDAQAIIDNAGIPDSISPASVGGAIKNIAKVTETVDTISDLRDFDTTQLQAGDKIHVRAHNSNGLDDGHGSGVFVWKTQELFTIQESATAGDETSFSVSATTIGLAGVGEPFVTNIFYGDNLVFENGGTATVFVSQQFANTSPTPEDERSYGAGSTDIRLAIDNNISTNEKAYFADDDGVYIRPTYAGFDGVGYWKRILDDGSVRVTDYGAIPLKSLRDTNPYDSTSAIQKAEDSLFNLIYPSGYYYLSSTVEHRRAKNVTFVGVDYWQQISPTAHGRFDQFIESDIRACIFSDLNIDLYRVAASGSITLMADCRLITTHTEAAVQVRGNERIKCNHNIYVLGNIDEYTGGNLTGGTRAWELVYEGLELPDTYSNGGSFSFNNVHVAASDCYSGISAESSGDGTGSFSNSNEFKLIGRGIVRPIYLQNTPSQTNIEGWHQELDDIPGAGNAGDTNPIIYMNDATGNYINFMAFDLLAKTDAHDTLMFIDAAEDQFELGRMTLGPRCLSQPMLSILPTKNYKFFDNATRLTIERDLNNERLLTTPQVLKKVITSAELLNSNTSTIELLASAPEIDGVLIEKVFIRPISGGTTQYSSETMELKVNTAFGDGIFTAATFDISTIKTSPTRVRNVAVNERDGIVFNSSSSGSAINLSAATADPTGGDFDIEIEIYYRNLAPYSA